MTTEQQISATKLLRENLERMVQELGTLPKGREVSIAITKTQEARMWLGQNLASLGNPSPYPNGNQTESTKVDPPAPEIQAGQSADGGYNRSEDMRLPDKTTE